MNAQKNTKTYRPRAGGPEFMRVGLVPGILAGVAILGGMALHDTDWFITIRFAVSILSAILIVFLIQGRAMHLRKWTWLTYVLIPLLGAIVVIWNPVNDLTQGWQGQVWLLVQVWAAAAAVFAGLFAKTPAPQN